MVPRVFPNTQMSRVISAYERKTQKQTKNEKERKKKMISYLKKNWLRVRPDTAGLSKKKKIVFKVFFSKK